MKLATCYLLFSIAATTCLASGITLATTAEAAARAKHIYTIKITKVTKPKTPYSGTKPYPITIEFELLEKLKGETTISRSAVYTIPAIQHTMPDGNTMGIWLQTYASGHEDKVTVGKEYLIYSEFVDPKSKSTFGAMRIEPISQKSALAKALKRAPKTQD